MGIACIILRELWPVQPKHPHVTIFAALSKPLLSVNNASILINF